MTEKERVRAIVHGQQEWETYGNAAIHRRYSQSTDSRKRCSCGCTHPVTHLGMANGVALMSGCELSVARWVRRLT